MSLNGNDASERARRREERGGAPVSDFWGEILYKSNKACYNTDI